MMPKNDFRSTPFGAKLFWYQIKISLLTIFMNSLVARLATCMLRRYGGVFNGGRVGSIFCLIYTCNIKKKQITQNNTEVHKTKNAPHTPLPPLKTLSYLLRDCGIIIRKGGGGGPKMSFTKGKIR